MRRAYFADQETGEFQAAEGRVRSAILHVISLAQYAAVCTRSWAADSVNRRVRLQAENDRLEQEVALRREEMRIKDARMPVIPPHRRPFYRPTERLAILELRAARGWSLQQTADALLVTPATVASWMKRIEGEGADALVQVRAPVNRSPDFVRYSVQRLQTLCPTLGKKKLAETDDFCVGQSATPLDQRQGPAVLPREEISTLV
jgi:hypothetical protein